MTSVADVRAAVARGGGEADGAAVSSAVVGAAGQAAQGWRALLELDARARAALVGAGELQDLLEDPLVTDVLVNGPRGVWVDRGRGLVPVPMELGGEAAVRALATRLAAACGQRLDEACPVVDGALPDGTRLHAVLPPVSADGTLISLRTQRGRALTVEELVAGGTVAPPLADVLRGLVATRANVLVSGAAGAGKTTLLAALLSTVGPHERIVCIEEAVELRPDHPHVVHLQVRRANVQRAGGVEMAELVRAAMRMRPDRLVLGECRGAEVREVLGALNTGHDGGWATVHANAPADVPARLIALGSLAGLGEHAVAVQAVSALDAVLHVSRTEDGRRLTEVGVLARRGPELVCDTALRVTARGEVREGPAWAALADRLDRRERA
ncbi:TadA family conjugal transfer-associated ATPase [Georgenia satyanarayanai]|uniref:TadA family conjugal transfer-associated ATPase n=1 Tax=Georgenia satyanarayanai TaxID=860221 RepID=UPI00203FFDA1|nr:TadA family conjugal transfer-associated ATPase [Georgenia satyanarayanai]MCM3662544.1 TadA family conjugal transfer-associated ATPase [Georgenia satyanarayanai]